MEYLTNLPEGLQNKGLCKVLLVRRESIHLKHILTVLFDKGEWINYFAGSFDLSYFMESHTKTMRDLYNISREYQYEIAKILSFKKDKFYEYLHLLEQLKPIIYLDEALPYHFIKNFMAENSNLHIIVKPLNQLNISNSHLFKFVIANTNEGLDNLWLYNYKTYFYKHGRIKNFSLYDK